MTYCLRCGAQCGDDQDGGTRHLDDLANTHLERDIDHQALATK